MVGLENVTHRDEFSGSIIGEVGTDTSQPINDQSQNQSVGENIRDSFVSIINLMRDVVLAWKPSSGFWRIFEFVDNVFYLLAWPFFIVSWCAFLGFCLAGFGLPLSPILTYCIGICAKLSYWCFVSLFVGIVFQLTAPFTMWKSFYDYHMLIAKYRRDDRGMFSMLNSAKSLVLVILPLMILQGLFFVVPKLFHLSASDLTFSGFYGFCKGVAFSAAKWGSLGLLALGVFALFCLLSKISDYKNGPSLYIRLKRENSGKFSSEVFKCGKNRSQLQGNKAIDEELYRRESVSVYNLGLENKLHIVIGSLWATASPGDPDEKAIQYLSHNATRTY